MHVPRCRLAFPGGIDARSYREAAALCMLALTLLRPSLAMAPGRDARRIGRRPPARRADRDRRRLRPRADVLGRPHDAAGPERSGSAGLAPGEHPFLVPKRHRRRRRVRAGGSGQGDESTRVRPRAGRGRALGVGGRAVRRGAPAVHLVHLRRRRQEHLVRGGRTPLHLRGRRRVVHQRPRHPSRDARGPNRVSPDGKLAAFIKNDNLWVRDVATGKETQLTTDGDKDFGYATDNAGWSKSDRPVLLWSPDSKKIATFQQDQRRRRRDVPRRDQGRPSDAAGLEVPAARRQVVTMIQRVVIHVDGPRVVRLKHAARPAPRRPHRRHQGPRRRLGRRAVERGRRAQLAFVSTSRDHKARAVPGGGRRRPAPCATCSRRRRRPTSNRGRARANWRFLPASNEVDLVLRARRLGAAVPLRSADRQAEEPDHDRRRQRDPDPARRREGAPDLLPRRRPREGPRPVLPPPLSRRLRREEPGAAHAG